MIEILNDAFNNVICGQDFEYLTYFYILNQLILIFVYKIILSVVVHYFFSKFRLYYTFIKEIISFTLRELFFDKNCLDFILIYK